MYRMSRRVLLTGGTGFVGHQILHHLRSKNVQMRLIVRPESVSKIHPPADGQDEIITSKDIFAENADWWARTCCDVDTVIHTAWYVETGKYQNSPKNLDCLIGTLQLAKGATMAQVRRFVGIGTCAEYEFAQQELSVDSSLNPLSPYAAAKAATYLSLSRCLPLVDIEFAWCRLFYLYGEGENHHRLVPTLRESLTRGQVVELSSGNQIRDFIDVKEAGRQIADVALGQQTGAVNVCSGKGTSVRAFAESIADEYGRRDLLKFGVRENNPIDPPFMVGVPSCQ